MGGFPKTREKGRAHTRIELPNANEYSEDSQASRDSQQTADRQMGRTGVGGIAADSHSREETHEYSQRAGETGQKERRQRREEAWGVRRREG